MFNLTFFPLRFYLSCPRYVPRSETLFKRCYLFREHLYSFVRTSAIELCNIMSLINQAHAAHVIFSRKKMVTIRLPIELVTYIAMGRVASSVGRRSLGRRVVIIIYSALESTSEIIIITTTKSITMPRDFKHYGPRRLNTYGLKIRRVTVQRMSYRTSQWYRCKKVLVYPVQQCKVEGSTLFLKKV